MKRTSLLPRFAALFLSVCLTLPSSPAFALRGIQATQSGVEEDMAKALGGQPVSLKPGVKTLPRLGDTIEFVHGSPPEIFLGIVVGFQSVPGLGDNREVPVVFPKVQKGVFDVTQRVVVTEWWDTGRVVQSVFDDVQKVGTDKPIGYLPLATIGSTELIQQLADEARGKGLDVLILTQEESSIGSGALYVFHREALERLIRDHRETLQQASIPEKCLSGDRHAEFFVRYLSKVMIMDEAARGVLGMAFGAPESQAETGTGYRGDTLRDGAGLEEGDERLKREMLAGMNQSLYLIEIIDIIGGNPERWVDVNRAGLLAKDLHGDFEMQLQGGFVRSRRFSESGETWVESVVLGMNVTTKKGKSSIERNSSFRNIFDSLSIQDGVGGWVAPEGKGLVVLIDDMVKHHLAYKEESGVIAHVDSVASEQFLGFVLHEKNLEWFKNILGEFVQRHPTLSYLSNLPIYVVRTRTKEELRDQKFQYVRDLVKELNGLIDQGVQAKEKKSPEELDRVLDDLSAQSGVIFFKLHEVLSPRWFSPIKLPPELEEKYLDVLIRGAMNFSPRSLAGLYMSGFVEDTNGEIWRVFEGKNKEDALRSIVQRLSAFRAASPEEMRGKLKAGGVVVRGPWRTLQELWEEQKQAGDRELSFSISAPLQDFSPLIVFARDQRNLAVPRFSGFLPVWGHTHYFSIPLKASPSDTSVSKRLVEGSGASFILAFDREDWRKTEFALYLPEKNDWQYMRSDPEAIEHYLQQFGLLMGSSETGKEGARPERPEGVEGAGLEEGEAEADPIQERLGHRGDYNKGESWWWWDYESEVSPLPEIPEAGYKLYVTGEPEEAGELIDLVLPFLRGRRIPHKVMKSAHLLRRSRSPEAPDNLKKEEGKFIVVYPPLPVGEKGRMSELARELNPDGFVLSEASIQTAAKLAMALDDLLAEANFPQRPKPISLVMSLPEGRSGRLFVRYGSFTGDSYYGPHPDFPGEVVVYEDIRDRSNAFPQWLGSEAEDPFLRAVTQEKAAPGYRGDTTRGRRAGLEEGKSGSSVEWDPSDFHGMVAVHALDFEPVKVEGGWIRPARITPVKGMEVNAFGKARIKTKQGEEREFYIAVPRKTVHFFVNGVVAPVNVGIMSWEEKGWVVVSPLFDLIQANPGRFMGGTGEDIFFWGDVTFPESSRIFRSLEEARRYLGEQGFKPVGYPFGEVLEKYGLHAGLHNSHWTFGFQDTYMNLRAGYLILQNFDMDINQAYKSGALTDFFGDRIAFYAGIYPTLETVEQYPSFDEWLRARAQIWESKNVPPSDHGRFAELLEEILALEKLTDRLNWEALPLKSAVEPGTGHQGDTLPEEAGLEQVRMVWEGVAVTPAYAGVEKGILPVLLPDVHHVAPLLAEANKFFVVLADSQSGLEEVRTLLNAVGAEPAGYQLRLIRGSISAAVEAVARDFPNSHPYLVDRNRISELLAGLEEEGIIPVGDYTRASQVTERHLAGQL